MPKFTFICEHDDSTNNTIKFEKEFLYDVVEEFERFLRGSGFVFDGQLEFVDDNVDKLGSGDFTVNYPAEDHYSPDETFFVNDDNTNHSFDIPSSAAWPFPHTTQASTVTGSRNEDILHVSV